MSHPEKCHQGQSGRQCLRSILPVKLGVKVAHYHQLGGHYPHLPSVQQDQRGPPATPEPLCLCLWNSRNKTKYSNQLTAAPPSPGSSSLFRSTPAEVLREVRGTRPKAFRRIPMHPCHPPLQAQKHQFNKFSTGLGKSQNEDNMFRAVTSNKKQFCFSLL